MIRRLRNKFILSAMISIFVVLTVILGSINLFNLSTITSDNDRVVGIILDNGGVFPKYKKPEKPKDRADFHPELQYETRYFSICISADGEVLWTNTGSIVSVTTQEATEIAFKVVEKNRSSGYTDVYRYGVAKDSENNYLVVFVDARKDLHFFKTFLLSSIIISFIGLLSVFVLVSVVAGKLTTPIAQSYEKQKRFITDASHEIKTPLAVISANAEVLEIESGDNDWLKSIRNQVERLTQLTQSLTVLAKMDEEGLQLDISNFSISFSVLDVLSGFEALVAKSDKQLNINVEDDIFYNGNERTIRQLVSILMDNAVKYSKSYIDVSLKKCRGKIILETTNDVDYIDEENLECVFDRFYRTDNSRSKETGGFGIGLSIAKSIVDFHKGKITASSPCEGILTITAIL